MINFVLPSRQKINSHYHKTTIKHCIKQNKVNRLYYLRCKCHRWKDCSSCCS